MGGSRRRKNKRQKKQKPKSAPRQQTPRAEQEVSQAETAARQAGLDPTPSQTPTREDTPALKQRLAGVIEAYEAATKAADTRETEALGFQEEAEKKMEDLSKREEDLNVWSHALEEQDLKLKADSKRAEVDRQSLDEERSQLDAHRRSVAERTEDLTKREAEADAGFLTRREESIAALEQAHRQLLEQNRELAEALESARQQHHEQLLKREEAHRQKCAEREQELEQRFASRSKELEDGVDERLQRLATEEKNLREQQTKLSRTQQQAELEQAELHALKDDIQEHIEDCARERVQALQAELQAEQERCTALRERIIALEQQLEELRRADRALGGESREILNQRLEAQQKRIDELRADLDERPSVQEGEELLALRKQRDSLQDERRTLLEELQRTSRQLQTLRISVDENEVLRDRNRALKSTQELLRAALDDLRADIDERLDKHRDQPVFPQLLEMDGEPELQVTSIRLYPGGRELELPRFADDLRHRIGRSSDEDKPLLYYSPQDVRAFLGGLAMSRLHLLQGISGIGKSSLPRRFAEAVGGHCTTVSVQAGWRDKNDLLGYFNAFERRYHEAAFVQALYRAQTPRWQDRPVIVLLDEMNLSHPEQYAADMLDVLERADRADRRFELMPAKQKGQQPAGIQEGRFLPLPDNVWFMGTANHDETTKDFADKTYDRSFVLELPGKPETRKLRAPRPRNPLSCAALMAAFDRAAEQHSSSADQAWTWLDDNLSEPMREHFGVGWGGRLEKQLRRFVPVVVACGGPLGEALDQLVTMRVLRRIRGRHDLLEEDVRDVLDVLEHRWPDDAAPPEAGVRLLKRELKRLGAEV